MKTNCLFAVMAVMLISGQSFAQPEIQKKGEFDETKMDFIPSAFTKSDKSLFLFIDYSEYYDDEHYDDLTDDYIVKDFSGNDIVTISVPMTLYQTGLEYQPVSADTVVSFESTDTYTPLYFQYLNLDSLSLIDAADTLKKYWVTYYPLISYVTFKDINGRDGFYFLENGEVDLSDFFKPDLFGTKYPEYYFAFTSVS